jgi:hypothetical protein
MLSLPRSRAIWQIKCLCLVHGPGKTVSVVKSRRRARLQTLVASGLLTWGLISVREARYVSHSVHGLAECNAG